MSKILDGLYNITSSLPEGTRMALTNESLQTMFGPDAPGLLEFVARQYAANLRNNSQPQVSEGGPNIVPFGANYSSQGDMTKDGFNLSCPEIT